MVISFGCQKDEEACVKNREEERRSMRLHGMSFGCNYPFFLTNNQRLVVLFSLSFALV